MLKAPLVLLLSLLMMTPLVAEDKATITIPRLGRYMAYRLAE